MQLRLRWWYPGARFIPRELGLGKAERLTVLSNAGDRWLANSWNGLWAFAWMAGGLIVATIAAPALGTWLYNTGRIALIVPAVLLLMLGVWWLFVIWQQRSGLPQCIYAELRDQGHDICRDCGYVRTGLESQIPCPECGVRSAPLANRQPGRSEVGRRLGLIRVHEEDAGKAVRTRLFVRLGRPNRETTFLAGVIATILVLGFLYEKLMGRLGFSPPDFIKPVVIGALIGLPATYMIRRYMQAGLYAELTKRGYSICPACGYLRKSIAADAPCTECGSTSPMVDR